jgi:spore coat polysaccharide biosynthesis protein SpsF
VDLNSVNCFIQARMSSSRLPGKVLLNVLDNPMLEYMLGRLQYSSTIDRVIVVTSLDLTDDPIEAFCKTKKVECFRGELDNVLDRYYKAALQYSSSHIIRLTADCPLIDPVVLDSVVHKHLRDNNDYTSNVCPPTFPDGMDVEVLTHECLCDIWDNATLPSEKGHVTRYIRSHINKYKCGSVQSECDWSSIRLTVDEKEDFLLIENIIEHFKDSIDRVSMSEIITYLREHPSLLKINSRFTRNSGVESSLKKDIKYLQERLI